MKTGVCTNLLGFLLTIPITTSFIEGRIPPFISPVYSPCETIEMGKRWDLGVHMQDEACAAPQDETTLYYYYGDDDDNEDVSAHMLLPHPRLNLRRVAICGTDGNNSLIDPDFKQSVTQLHISFFLISFNMQSGCKCCKLNPRFCRNVTEHALRNEKIRLYVHFLSCPFLPFHPGRDAVWRFRAAMPTEDWSTLPPAGKPRLHHVVIETGSQFGGDDGGRQEAGGKSMSRSW